MHMKYSLSVLPCQLIRCHGYLSQFEVLLRYNVVQHHYKLQERTHKHAHRAKETLVVTHVK